MMVDVFTFQTICSLDIVSFLRLKNLCDKYLDEQLKYQLPWKSTKFNHDCKESAKRWWLLKILRSGPRNRLKE